METTTVAAEPVAAAAPNNAAIELLQAVDGLKRRLANIGTAYAIASAAAVLAPALCLIGIVDANHASSRPLVAWLYALLSWSLMLSASGYIVNRWRKGPTRKDVARGLSHLPLDGASDVVPALALVETGLSSGESPQLRDAYLDEVWNRLRVWHWAKLIDDTPLQTAVRFAVVSLVSAMGLVALAPRTAAFHALRVAAPWYGAAWPCPYAVHLVEYPATVLQGERAMLKIWRRGNAPIAEVHFWTAGRHWKEKIEWSRDAAVEFATSPLFEDVHIQLRCGEIATSLVPIRAVPRPEVLTLHAETRKVACDKVFTEPLEGLNWRAPRHGELNLDVVANAPLETVRFTLLNEGHLMGSWELSQDGSPRQWRISEHPILERADHWRLTCTLPSMSECLLAEGAIELVDDQPPQVSWKQRPWNFITPGGAWRGELVLSNDRDFERVMLKAVLKPQAADTETGSTQTAPTQTEPTETLDVNDDAEGSISFDHVSDEPVTADRWVTSGPNVRLKLLDRAMNTPRAGETGGVIMLSVDLPRDQFPLAKPGDEIYISALIGGCRSSTTSPPLCINVISPEEFRQLVQEELRILESEANRHASQQERIKQLLAFDDDDPNAAHGGAELGGVQRRWSAALDLQRRQYEQMASPRGIARRFVYLREATAEDSAPPAGSDLQSGVHTMDGRLAAWLEQGILKDAETLVELVRLHSPPRKEHLAKDNVDYRERHAALSSAQDNMLARLRGAASEFRRMLRLQNAEMDFVTWQASQRELWQDTQRLGQEFIRWSFDAPPEIIQAAQSLAERQAELSVSLNASLALLASYEPELKDALTAAARIPNDLRNLKLLQAQAAQRRLLDQLPELIGKTDLALSGANFNSSGDGNARSNIADQNADGQSNIGETSGGETSAEESGDGQTSQVQEDVSTANAQDAAGDTSPSFLDNLLTHELVIRDGVNSLQNGRRGDDASSNNQLSQLAKEQRQLTEELEGWTGQAAPVETQQALSPDFDPLTAESSAIGSNSTAESALAMQLAQQTSASMRSALRQMERWRRAIESVPKESSEQITGEAEAANAKSTQESLDAAVDAIRALKRHWRKRPTGANPSEQVAQSQRAEPNPQAEVTPGNEKQGDSPSGGGSGSGPPTANSSQSGDERNAERALGLRELPPAVRQRLGAWRPDSVPPEFRDDVNAYFEHLINAAAERD